MSATQRAPVVLCLFDRPAETRRVVAAIRAARPPRVYAIADGPPPGDAAAARRCAAARAEVERLADTGELIRDYAPTNLGCGRRIASGLTRVFAAVEEAIVLEDDCLPDASFFPYCEALLARYRDEPRVMMVSGCNDLIEWRPAAHDYFFSRYGSVWGWATWRRAWRLYDFAMRSWRDRAAGARLAAALGDAEQVAHRLEICERTARGDVDTWDYQWTWTRLWHDGLAAVPARNLVTNIGFGGGATHTARRGLAANLPRHALPLPLRPPATVAADVDYDRRWFEWQAGCASAAAVLERADALLRAGRYAQVLLLARERAAAAAVAERHAELRAITARALAALRAAGGAPAAAAGEDR